LKHGEGLPGGRKFELELFEKPLVAGRGGPRRSCRGLNRGFFHLPYPHNLDLLFRGVGVRVGGRLRRATGVKVVGERMMGVLRGATRVRLGGVGRLRGAIRIRVGGVRLV
jgi:hypothetical protein